MNAIAQTKRILPEERAKIWNQVTRKTVAIGMITDESIYPITLKITTTIFPIHRLRRFSQIIFLTIIVSVMELTKQNGRQKTKWLIYTVLVGLIPILSRLLVHSQAGPLCRQCGFLSDL